MNKPKYSLETEHEVLETLMHLASHKELLAQKAMLKLDSDCFYNSDNKAMFNLIQDCFRAQKPFHYVDILSLIPRDRGELHDAMQWLMDNYGKMHAGEANFLHYVDRLVILRCLRKQIKLLEQLLHEVDICEDANEAQKILTRYLREISNLTYNQSRDGISYQEIAELYYQDKLPLDLIYPTTYAQLNAVNGGGIMGKSLITIGAGAGVGKTGFALFLLDAIARAQPGTQSLFYSLEMEAKQIWKRQVGICAGKKFENLTEDEKLLAIEQVNLIPTQIFDSSMCINASDIDFILTTSRLRAMETKISVIVVDYLGLVDCKGSFESNALKQTEITSRLARLAIELDCILIALSQVNRSPSSRATDDRCPYPSDASGSSGSYFSSSLWIGVDRPELYQDDPIYRNQFVIKCRKNRFGSNFELTLAFNEGTFAEVPENWFKKPCKEVITGQKAVFPAHGKDFYNQE